MERRNLFRVDFKTNVDLINDNITTNAKLKNLNLAGIYIQTSNNVNFEPNTLLDVIIGSDRNILKFHLKLKGKILRNDNNGIVIKFTKMGPKVFEELKRIISFRSKMIKNEIIMDCYLYSESNSVKKFKRLKTM